MSHPEIYEMQAEALFEALCHAVKKGFKMVQLELLIPFVSFVSEVKWLKEKINACADTVRKQEAMNFTYKLGVIIELPRAAIRADDIARHVDFISFGTNDLTQTTLGISRDDASPFLADYQRKKIIQFDPFVTLDIQGVGRLVEIATFMAKSVKPEIEMSLCGEHGGDPKTISFCQRLGIDYVSCSPYRVPVARLAAAQAVLWQKQNETQEVKTKNIKLSIE
jgi:pyruvate,orthophosphate dikinase